MTIQTSIELGRKCKPFPPETYEFINLNSLAAYTIWFLRNNNLLVTFESITVALFLMFPKKFSLVGYEEYPDSTRVLRSLLQLRPKYRNWATGDAKRGFSLTETGLAVAQRTGKLLENPQLQERKELPRTVRTRQPEQEVEKIISSEPFRKYVQEKHDSIDKLEILELLRAVPYTPPRVLRRYLEELRTIAHESNNKQALEFLSWARKRFSSMFSDSG